MTEFSEAEWQAAVYAAPVKLLVSAGWSEQEAEELVPASSSLRTAPTPANLDAGERLLAEDIGLPAIAVLRVAASELSVALDRIEARRRDAVSS